MFPILPNSVNKEEEVDDERLAAEPLETCSGMPRAAGSDAAWRGAGLADYGANGGTERAAGGRKGREHVREHVWENTSPPPSPALHANARALRRLAPPARPAHCPPRGRGGRGLKLEKGSLEPIRSRGRDRVLRPIDGERSTAGVSAAPNLAAAAAAPPRCDRE